FLRPRRYWRGTMTAAAEAPVETPVLDADDEYPPHAQAVVFPPLSPDRYKALKASIAAHGQQQPIEVQKGTMLLLDGRHRLRACNELGIATQVRQVDIDDGAIPIYTGAKAARRDGLTATQR